MAKCSRARRCLHKCEQVPHAVLIRTRGLLQLAGVLVFSATPFVVVKAIANSAVGEALQRRLKVRKEEDERQAAAAKSAQEKAKQERSVPVTAIVQFLQAFLRGFLSAHSYSHHIL